MEIIASYNTIDRVVVCEQDCSTRKTDYHLSFITDQYRAEIRKDFEKNNKRDTSVAVLEKQRSGS